MQATSALDAHSLTDVAHVTRVVRRAGTSFFWAMRLLPSERRRAIFAVYAFCREVDDVADSDLDAAAKRAGLAAWRDEVAALFDGRPARPTTRALAGPVQRFELDRADFEAVIDGMAMDAAGAIVAPSRAELTLYCDRVAAAVGRLCVRVFGEPTPAGRRVADELGQALQLTNILRDLDEDAALGRLYLPREVLERHGVPAVSPHRVLAHPGLEPACREVAGWAAAAFERARLAMVACDARAMRPARMMMEVYRLTLARLDARGWQPPRRSCGPGKAEKLWLAVRCLAGTGV